MGGATVYLERVNLQDFQKLVFQQQLRAQEVGLYLRSIYMKACPDSTIIFDVTLEFSK